MNGDDIKRRKGLGKGSTCWDNVCFCSTTTVTCRFKGAHTSGPRRAYKSRRICFCEKVNNRKPRTIAGCPATAPHARRPLTPGLVVGEEGGNCRGFTVTEVIGEKAVIRTGCCFGISVKREIDRGRETFGLIKEGRNRLSSGQVPGRWRAVEKRAHLSYRPIGSKARMVPLHTAWIAIRTWLTFRGTGDGGAA